MPEPPSKKLKTLFSPQADVAKTNILNVEYTVTEIKEIVAASIKNGESKEETAVKINAAIKKALKEVAPEEVPRYRQMFNVMAQRDYFALHENMKVLNRNLANKVTGYNIDPINPSVVADVHKFRGYETSGDKGLPVIEDYQKSVRLQMKALSADPPLMAAVDKNSRPYTMSGRNYAEMTTRYEANAEDVKKLIDEGTDLVWISSHADASPRCSPYQGKLYSLKGSKGRTADGHEYDSILPAMEGPKGDGNGIINGYNCRHYLIEYTPGSKPPKDYDKTITKKENDITIKQRNYENEIRQLKTQQRLASASGDTKLAKALSERWHRIDAKYKAFSLNNGRAFYPWRTVVGRDEKIASTKWGEAQTSKETRAIENSANQKILRAEKADKIASGIYKDEVRQGSQNKHILGTKEYNDALKRGIEKPYFTTNANDLKKLEGTGIINKRDDGQIIEIIETKTTIGVYVSHAGTDREIRVPTNKFEIRYSSKGWHVIPKPPVSKK